MILTLNGYNLGAFFHKPLKKSQFKITMNTSIPDNYDTLLEFYLSLKNDFEEVKQSLHDSSRQVKINEALIREYQAECEMLHQAESSLLAKHQAKISSLEETITYLRSNHSENISCLELELSKKEKNIEELKHELNILKNERLANENNDVSSRSNEVIELANENDLLKEKYGELNEAYERLHSQTLVNEHALQDYKQELAELKESLNAKREEMTEKNALIDKLNDEVLSLTTELAMLKDIPLDEGSKGNSLFAEVDDRRVHLQKTVNDMKSNYIHLKQEHSKHEKIISQLRNENAKIRDTWKKDIEQIEEDNNSIIESLRSRLKFLEEINERQKQQLKEQPKLPSDDLFAEYQFYQNIIESKSLEIEKLEEKLSDRCVNEHMLSVQLAQAHKELRLLNLSTLDLQKQIEEEKAKNLSDKEVALYRRYTTYDEDAVEELRDDEENVGTPKRSEVKSCLRRIENTIHNDSNPLSRSENEGLIKFEEIGDIRKIGSSRQLNKDESISADDIENTIIDAGTKRGVKFTEDTVSPVSKPRGLRGTKIFVMK